MLLIKQTCALPVYKLEEIELIKENNLQVVINDSL